MHRLHPKILLASFLVFFSSSLLAAPGALDTTFNTTGWASTGDQLVPVDDFGNGLIRQTDGKLVVVGSTTTGVSKITLVRYNTDGSLDTSFNGTGKVITGIGAANLNSFGRAVAQQSDGKLVVAGDKANGLNEDYAVLRYNADGSLDTSFGTSGVFTYDGGSDDFLYAIAVQADGKIAVAGKTFVGANFSFAVLRLNTNGTLDTAFNTTGIATTAINAAQDNVAYSLIQQADGKLVAAGYSNVATVSDFAVVRYTTAGALDITFNTTGKVDTPVLASFDVGRSVIQQADGKLVVAGYAMNGTNYDFAIVRYTTAGSLDTTFNTTGKQTTAIGAGDDLGLSVIQDSSLNLVVAGCTGTTNTAGAITVCSTGGDFALARYTSAGALDTSFNTTGKVTTPILAGIDQATSIIQDGSGNYVAAGYAIAADTKNDIAVARYNSTGALDTTFNTTGKVTTNVGGQSADTGAALVIQADGKLLVAGNAALNSGATVTNFAAARFTSAGALDTTFNGTGRVITPVGSSNLKDLATAAIQQADGKLVLGGYARMTVGNDDFALVRYNLDGTLDTTFNTTGKVTTPIGASADHGNALVQQADGKLVLAGYTFGANFDVAVVRYNLDGSLDTSFNTTGKVTTPVGTADDVALAVIQQVDGKLVIAGYSNSGATTGQDFMLIRYNTDGSLDTTFNTTGKVVTAVATGNVTDQAWGLVQQSDGKLVAAGYASNGTNFDFAVVRYNTDGTLDTTFNSTGKVITPIGAGADQGAAVTLQSDGKIVVTGFSNNGSNDDFALVRYNTDGTLDTSFNTTGKVTTPIGIGTDHIAGIKSQADGKLVVGGYSTTMSTGTEFVVARYESGVSGGNPCLAGTWWNGTVCVNASAGHYVPSNGATSETACAAGTYQPSTGQTSCISAPAGSFASGTGNTSATLCAAGSFTSTTGQASCTLAPAGSFASGTGNTTSTLCAAGSFTSTTGQSSCTAAPAGSFASGTGNTSATLCVTGSFTSTTGQSSCTLAPAGSFAAGPGATGSSLCAAGSFTSTAGNGSCTLASAGSFVSGTGATSQTAAPAGSFASGTGNTSATLCAAGSFTSTTGQASCTSASAGNFVASSGATSQTLCAAGSFQSLTGQTSCTSAPAGSFASGTGNTTSTLCAAGSFTSTSGQASCTLAPAGSFASGTGNTTSTLCAAGSYTNTAGNASCTLASAGSFVSGTGATTQTACAAGTFTSTTGQSSCTSAPAGSFASGTGNTSATLCAAGSFTSTTGQASCTSAPAGSFASGTGNTSATLCAAGSFTSTSGQASCTSAPAGSFASGTGNTSATLCAAGSFTSTSGQSSCTSAPAGSFASGTGNTSATLCAAGSFTSTSGQASCTAAPAGSYATGPGATSSTLCALGSYSSTTGNSSCTTSPANFYVSTTGATSPTACPVSTTSPAGSTSAAACVPVGNPCLAGTWWNGSVCVNASAGHYVPVDGATSETACAAGTYQPSTGQSSCISAPAGSFAAGTGNTSATLCAAGSITGSSGMAACTLAPAGSFAAGTGNTFFTLCAAGSFTSTTGQASCTLAPAGSFAFNTGNTSATLCAAGSFTSSAGQNLCTLAPAGSHATGTGNTSAALCAAGSFTSSTGQANCTLASAGSFVAGTGATSQTAAPAGSFAAGTGNTSATLCAAGSFTSTPGQSSCTAAPAGSHATGPGATSSVLCTAGSFTSTSGQANCTPASAGSFVAGSGATSQTACAAGTYQPSTGQTSCISAPAGSYVAGSGATGATLCAAGSYQPLTGQTSCTLASAGFYVPTTGQTSQTPCASGFSSLAGATACFALVVKNDFNGDHSSDILLQQTATGVLDMALLNGVTPLSESTLASFVDPQQLVVSTADFNNDGKSDILTRGSATAINPGRFHLYLMSGTTISSEAWMDTLSTNLNDVVMSVKDYNADGNADVLLRNSVTGVWTMNYMHGTAAPTVGTLNATTDLCYTLQGDGDYDGNGYPDLLLRKDAGGACGTAAYPWLLTLTNGNFTIMSSGVPSGVAQSAAWVAVATDKDFDGDGKTDLLLRYGSGTTQQWVLYNMNGLNSVTGQVLSGVAVQSIWQLAGSADFDGNGRPDLLLREVATGQYYIYLMNNTSPSSGFAPGVAVGLIWTLQGLDDNNGDGKADILLRHGSTGAWQLNLMNGVTVQQATSALSITYDVAWTLQND